MTTSSVDQPDRYRLTDRNSGSAFSPDTARDSFVRSPTASSTHVEPREEPSALVFARDARLGSCDGPEPSKRCSASIRQ